MKTNLNCEGGRAMKLITSVLLAVLLAVTVGCGDTHNHYYDVVCSTDEDCAKDCVLHDEHACSEGKCICSTVTSGGCESDEDCADSCAGSDDFSCNQESTCVCHDEAVSNGCAFITRGELVERLYKFNGYTRCDYEELNASCTDIPEGTEQSCKWAVLQEAGIFDIVGECHPDFLLNRAEFIKIVVSMIDGLADYEAPQNPTFDDVFPEQWFFDFVEAAVQLVLITGYIDEDGNLTGKFGPANPADVCWVELVLSRIPKKGTIVVTVVPEEATFDIYRVGNEEDVETYTGSAVIRGMAFGDYRVVYQPLPGYITPDPSVPSISESHPVSAVVGVYVPEVPDDDPLLYWAPLSTSTTTVKGSDNVPSLSFVMEAGNKFAAFKSVPVRVYADTLGGENFSATGDLAANTIIASMKLMTSGNVAHEPVALQLVDVNGDGFFTPDSDYYQVVFGPSNWTYAPNTRRVFTVEVDLLNTMMSTVYYALDIHPEDVVAEDSDANTVTVQGRLLNAMDGYKSPEMRVLTSGQLSAGVESNPDSNIVVAGSQDVWVNRYRFNAASESFLVNKLTIVNDPDGMFGDNVVDTYAVSAVKIRYTDQYNVPQVRTAALVAGQCTFSGLDLYAADWRANYLDIYIDVPTIAMMGDGLSGQSFRLGIQEVGNTASTYEAIGMTSSEADYVGDFYFSSDAGTFVVRAMWPYISSCPGLPIAMTEGENILGCLEVCTDAAGSVELNGLDFGVTPDLADTATLSNFQIAVGASMGTTSDLTLSEANITGLIDCGSGGGGGDLHGTMMDFNFDASSCTGTVTVEFEIPQWVSATCNYFKLKADVIGAVTDDTLTTEITDVLWSDGSASGIDGWGLGLEEIPARTIRK